MPVQVVRHLDEALDALAAMPRAEPIAGGTDLMVEINFGRRRVSDVVAIDRVDELKELRTGREFRVGAGGDTRIRVGGGVTYTQLLTDGAGSVALWEASRTVGSPQIRNAGTIGGNLATSSPAGDTLPVLAALDATVVLRSREGERRVKFGEFMTGPKRNVRRRDELVLAAEWDDAGPAQTFIKVGPRMPSASRRDGSRSAGGTGRGVRQRPSVVSSVALWPRPRGRSTTYAAPPRIGVTCSRSSRRARSIGWR